MVLDDARWSRPCPTPGPVAAAPAGDACRSPRARRSTGDEVDVAIIGGGVNGTGVARDLALRGLQVALFERNDLAFGASGNSSGMIHGGVRYLSQRTRTSPRRRAATRATSSRSRRTCSSASRS